MGVGVGALGTDQQHRAWFSNYGNWVDVYALGEGIVNAYATGVYTYQEPPKPPAKQTSRGWLGGTAHRSPRHWSPGLSREQMAQSGITAAVAAQALLNKAQAQAIPGVGPALFPP